MRIEFLVNNYTRTKEVYLRSRGHRHFKTKPNYPQTTSAMQRSSIPMRSTAAKSRSRSSQSVIDPSRVRIDQQYAAQGEMPLPKPGFMAADWLRSYRDTIGSSVDEWYAAPPRIYITSTQSKEVFVSRISTFCTLSLRDLSDTYLVVCATVGLTSVARQQENHALLRIKNDE